MPSLKLGADSFTEISLLSVYFDNGVHNCHQIWYDGSPCPYLALCKSINNKYNAICPFLTFFVKTNLLIFPPIFAQSPLNFQTSSLKKV